MWLQDRYRQWRYKNLTLLFLGIGTFFILAQNNTFKAALVGLGEWGYLGAIICGVFSVMTFTAAPALLVLYDLSTRLNLVELALLTGLGAVIGDFIIFTFFKNQVFTELEPLIKRLSHSPVSHLLHSKYFVWLMPVIGAIILASPLPDELGVPLLSMHKIKKWQFIILSFSLNTVGVLILISSARAILN